MSQLKSIPDLLQDLDNTQPDNTNQEISAADVREQAKNAAFSAYNKVTDSLLVSLRDFSTARAYEQGEGVLYLGNLYQANTSHSGAWNPANFDLISSGGGSSISIGSPANGLTLISDVLSLGLASTSLTGALSSTDWNTFNGKQDALGFTPEDAANKGAANGYVPLNASAKIDNSYLDAGLLGSVTYRGVWNAATNTPALADGDFQGDYYVVNVAGTQDLGSGPIVFSVGDWVINNGTVWDKLDNSAPGVNSVQGLQGDVDLGSGALRNLVRFTAANTFEDSLISTSAGGNIGIGTPADSSRQISFGYVGTGLRYVGGTNKSVYQELDGTITSLWSKNTSTGLIKNSFLYAVNIGQNNTEAGHHLEIAPSTVNSSQIRLDPSGANFAPAGSTDNGALWATSTSLYYRHNGLTVDLLAGGGGGSTDPYVNTNTGTLWGLEVTINAGDAATFDVAVGQGIIWDWSDPQNPTYSIVSVSAPILGIALPDITKGFSIPYLIADDTISTTSGERTTATDYRTKIELQSVSHTNGVSITEVTTARTPAYDLAQGLYDWVRAVGTINEGNLFSANGPNLKVDKSSGKTVLPFINQTNDPLDPATKINAGQSAPFIVGSYRDGAGDYTLTFGDVIDPNNWDNGSGTLQSVPQNDWTIIRFYFFGQNEQIGWTYGQATYANEDEAISNIFAENPVLDPILGAGVFTTALVVKEGTTTLEDTAKAHFIRVISSTTGGNSSSVSSAVTVSYDNSTSGLPGQNVQSAIDELASFKVERGGDDAAVFSNALELTFAATMNLDLSLRDNFTVSNVQSTAATITASNLSKGQVITLDIKQDGVGGRALTLDAATFIKSNLSPDVGTEPNDMNTITGKVVDISPDGVEDLKIIYSVITTTNP